MAELEESNEIDGEGVGEERVATNSRMQIKASPFQGVAVATVVPIINSLLKRTLHLLQGYLE